MSSVEDENTEELLKLLETFFNPKIIGDICKAALDSWGLVSSSLSDEILASDELLERYLYILQSLCLLYSKISCKPFVG